MRQRRALANLPRAAWSYNVGLIAGEIPYKALGCFRDNHNLYRPLPSQIFSDSQETIDFKEWPNYLSDAICRFVVSLFSCGKIARVFSIAAIFEMLSSSEACVESNQSCTPRLVKIHPRDLPTSIPFGFQTSCSCGPRVQLCLVSHNNPYNALLICGKRVLTSENWFEFQMRSWISEKRLEHLRPTKLWRMSLWWSSQWHLLWWRRATALHVAHSAKTSTRLRG